MVAPDPVDVHLLTAIAESGRTAIPELAGRLGMDVRDVAARLAALSTTGLPLIVGVECDPQGIRNAVAAAHAWNAQAAGQSQATGQSQTTGQPGPNPASEGYPVPPANSGPYPAQSGPYTGQPGPYPAQSGPAPAQPVASGPHQPYPSAQPQAAPAQASTAPPQMGSQPHPMRTWGPPGSAAWAGGAGPHPGQRSSNAAPPHTAPQRVGTVGSTLETLTLEGANVAIQLVEVVDPADFLFTAAGYELADGQRSVIVHTELTNQGSTPFTTLPDAALVLVTADGSTISKSPAALSSRPAHRPGIMPGATAGGHTVYLVPESTSLSAVRWSSRSGDEQRSLSWDISDL